MIFETVRITWKGRDYSIPPDQLLHAIAKVEDVITMGELTAHLERQTLPLAKLAKALGAALRHAGARVSDEDIYAAMFGAEAKDIQDNAVASALTLQAMMVPPVHLRREPGKAAAAGQESASSPTLSS